MMRLTSLRATTLAAMALLATAIATAPATKADEILPPGSKPLSSILKTIEDKKTGAVKEAEYDDGLWEIKTINPTGDVVIYKVDPRDGSIIREKTDTERHADRPASDDKPLSEIVAMIEQTEKAPVSHIEFDDDVWKVTLRSETDKIWFHLDPKTGNKLPMR